MIKDFLAKICKGSDLISIPYSTLGLRHDTDFMVWTSASQIDAIHDHFSSVANHEIMPYLDRPYTFLGMTRPSPYTGSSSAKHHRGLNKYLIIYPFTKTSEWYVLPYDKRKDMMDEHIRVAKEFKGIQQILYYSFGIGDQEFIVVYETDSLENFQSLVMRLRETRVRLYTLRDIPNFVCIKKDIEELARCLS